MYPFKKKKKAELSSTSSVVPSGKKKKYGLLMIILLFVILPFGSIALLVMLVKLISRKIREKKEANANPGDQTSVNGAATITPVQ